VNPKSKIRNLKSEIVLPAGSGREVEITYTALGASAPEKLRFKRRLEGFDQGWVDAGTERQVRYTNLRPGRYRFQLTADNRHGAWNENGAMLSFLIQPFAYQTWWFQSALAALMATALLGGYSWRVRELRRIHLLEEQKKTGGGTRAHLPRHSR